MSNVSAYILSIAGIVLLSVIVELVLCEGQMKKYIKSIFSFFIIGVIISPLPNLISSKSISSIFQIEDYDLQNSFLSSVNSQKAEAMASDMITQLSEIGYENVNIVINPANGYFSDFQIKRVNISVKDMTVSEKAKNSDRNKIREEIIEYVSDRLDIKKEIIVYEDE